MCTMKFQRLAHTSELDHQLKNNCGTDIIWGKRDWELEDSYLGVK